MRGDNVCFESHACPRHGRHRTTGCVQIGGRRQVAVCICSAWWGFTNSSDQQRVEAFIRRSARCNLAPADLGSFEQLCKTADERLFDSILGNTDHVLHHLLPPQSEASLNDNLRPRTHNL